MNSSELGHENVSATSEKPREYILLERENNHVIMSLSVT